jgi:hypothetical protein
MSESNKSPTEVSTRPLGNTGSVGPTPLTRDISPHVAAKLRQHHPEQNKRMREHLRLKQTHSGHARD